MLHDVKKFMNRRFSAIVVGLLGGSIVSLGIAQKVRLFLILVPKTAMISWQKLANISMELNAASFVVTSIGL